MNTLLFNCLEVARFIAVSIMFVSYIFNHQEGLNMDAKEIITALFDMCEDMDKDDYDETIEAEFEEAVEDLEEIEGTTLYKLCEFIAMRGQGKPQSFLFVFQFLIIEIISAAGVQLLK